MSTEQLTGEAMALPLKEKIALAQALWENINAGLADTSGTVAVQEAIARDKELESGQRVGRSHDDVIQSARRAIGCD